MDIDDVKKYAQEIEKSKWSPNDYSNIDHKSNKVEHI